MFYCALPNFNKCCPISVKLRPLFHDFLDSEEQLPYMPYRIQQLAFLTTSLT